MSFRTLQAVVFDWAGTVIDFGSQAPMGAFVELFARHGVAISIAEARGPMGLPKWHHIQALGQQPRIAAAWLHAHGRPFCDTDVDALYEEFTPMNAESVKQHATLITGAADMVARLRAAGLKIGSTTGYNRPIMDTVVPLAAAQGFAPDNLVCAGDLPESRPSAAGMLHTLQVLGGVPPQRAVKVDDTLPGLLEGRNAGAWTVAVLASGNAAGLTEAQWQTLTETERDTVRQRARAELAAAHPDAWVDTVADLWPVLLELDARASTLRAGAAAS